MGIASWSVLSAQGSGASFEPSLSGPPDLSTSKSEGSWLPWI